MIDWIKNELELHKNATTDIKIGYIKQVAQIYVLSYLYEQVYSKDLRFYGGTAMRILHGLDRLSEDLDFVSLIPLDRELLGHGLKVFFAGLGFEIEVKNQHFRTTLSFYNLLDKFNLLYSNSTTLRIKIEISDNFAFAKNYQIVPYPKSEYGRSLVINSFTLPDLMGTKLNAVLYRTRTNERKGATFKGRDIYDLFRYLTQKIKPNLGCVDGVDDIHILKTLLVEKINSIDFDRSINDIQFFIENQNSLDNFKRYAKDFMLREIASR